MAGASTRKICALNSNAAAVTRIAAQKHADSCRERQIAINVSAVNAAANPYALPGAVNNNQ